MPINLGTFEVDKRGDFDIEFQIPQNARVPSTNRIIVTPRFGEALTVFHFIPNSRITVNPGTALVGDEIVISLDGTRSDYTLPTGALNIGGTHVPLPGYVDVPGEKAKTNSSGSATFTVTVPVLASGRHTVDILGATGEVTTTSLTVLEGILQIVPASAIPGQTVYLRSRYFSPSTTNEPGRSNVPEISGVGESMLQIDGQRVGPNYVNYPIKIGLDGQAFFPFTLPTDSSVTSMSQLRISAIDTEGRRSAGNLRVSKPIVNVSPDSGLRDSQITLRGWGFVVGKNFLGNTHRIELYYGEELVKLIHADSQGGVTTQFRVPKDADAGTEHAVTARVLFADVQASAAHKIPAPGIVLSPDRGPAGSVVRIIGTGYPPNAPMTSVRLGFRQASVPPSKTNDLGNFSLNILVPEELQLGQITVSVSTISSSTSGKFIVTAN